MRIHRANRRAAVRPTTVERARAEAKKPARQVEAGSGFDVRRARGPALTTPQQQMMASFDEALRLVAQELLRLANGLAPQAASAPSSAATGPSGVTRSGAQPPGEFGPPPPPPPAEVGTPSGFSPVAPPGVGDPRVPPPYTIAEKKAGTFPAQLEGESLAQYALRTAAQTGFNVSALGALVHTAGSLGADAKASYAELVDRFQNPTAYWSKAELDRQNMMREADIRQASQVYTGPVSVHALSDDDKRYLAGVEQWLPQVGDLWHKLLSGSHVDIARAINDTFYNLGTANFDYRNYRGQMRALVEQVMAEKGIKHP